MRQAIAAHYLRSCREIVEIGGAGLPITDFITHAPDSVTVFDPKITPFASDELNGRSCRVRHVAEKFQAADLPNQLRSLGVVLLGLSLKPFGERAALDDSLIGLLRRAEVAVIDYSLTLPRAVEQAPVLLAEAGLVAALTIDLDIVDGVLDVAGHGRRRLHVLRASRALVPGQ